MGAAAFVLPEFALIALGAVLRRRAWRSERFWVDLERLVYLVLFPALLLRTTLGADLGAPGAGQVLLASLGATLAGVLLGATARLLPRAEPWTVGSAWQTAFRFNTYLALAVVDDAGPAALALMGVLIGVNVPVVNVLAVISLLRARESAPDTAAPAGADHAGPGRAATALTAVARNPLVLATVVGLAGNLAGVVLPSLLDDVLARLAAAAVPLGLLSVGAALRVDGLGRSRLVAVHAASVKLVAVPAVALGLAAALGITGEQREVLIAFAAVPPATASYVLAARMGGDGAFVAAQVSLATVAALLTLPLWLAVPT